jgi:hypothetical protein
MRIRLFASALEPRSRRRIHERGSDSDTRPHRSKVKLAYEESAMALTGKFKHRKALWGRIVLQVEEEVKPFWSRSTKPRWRDATLMDLAAPEMRCLIDMGLKPWTRSQRLPAAIKVADTPRAEMSVSAEAVPAPVQQADSEPVPTSQ